MSVVKRGARAGAAAVALGVTLIGPQASGIAAADPMENDSPSASASQPAQAHSGQARGRTSPSAQTAGASADVPHRGRVSPQPAATLDASDAPVADTVEPQPSRGMSTRRRSTGPSRDSAPVPAQSTTSPVPVSATVAAVISNVTATESVTTGARPAQSVAPVRGAGVAVNPVALPAAATANAVTTPAPAPAVAALGAAVTRFFDSTANWMSSLPASPLTEVFQGALLLVRRSFFNLFPALNVGQTTGQTGTNPAYFTQDQLRDYLLGLAKQQYGDLYGQTVPVYGYGPYPEYSKTDSATPSDTNTQVNGVDEADFVENDGNYVYVAHNGRLTITRADELSVASESTLTGDAVGEYLSGDRLTVVSQAGSGWYGPTVKMAYGNWGPWKPQTTVTVYDVADRTAPTVVNQTVLDGAYQSSRAVDGVVYLVLQRSVNLPAPAYTDTPIQYLDTPAAQGDSAVSKIRYDPSAPIAYRTYETWDDYVARVGGDIVGLSLPHAYGVDAVGNMIDLGLVAGAGDIVRPQTPDQQSLVTVVAVDSAHASRSGFVDSAAAMVSGWSDTVYMNQGALYVATNQDHSSDTVSATDTRIDRFVVAGPDVTWQSSGTVSGTLINQFAMDEQDGYLRVAAHTNGSELVDGAWVTRDDNGIHVLDISGTELKEVGGVTGLAPGEQLYAVRYVGDTAYLVTFVRTDPLIAVDLSNPTAPVLQGELVVPGFSNYLQSVGDGLLLGIGQDRETGNGNTHLDATLFDVSDGAKLTLVDREYLDSGYQWSWSEGQFDHHALLYSAQDGVLVVPVSASGYDAQSGYRYDQYLKVLRVGPAGIEVVGEIHPREDVIRTVRIGDVLYAVGDTSVTAYSLRDLSEIGTTAAAPSVV